MPTSIISFVLGVCLLQIQAALPTRDGMQVLAGLSFLLVFIAYLGRNIKPVRYITIKSFFLLLGFLYASLTAQSRLNDALASEWEGQDIELVGVVASMPQINERGVRFEFDVENIVTRSAIVPKHISLSWYRGKWHDSTSPLPEVHAGQRWQLIVRLKRPHGNANPHGFDYEAWLLERNIRATGYVRAGKHNQLVQQLVITPGYLVEHLREQVRQRLSRALENKEYAGVLVALAIGDQQSISPSQWQIFTRTGVNHLMSISGLHVTMVSGLIFTLAYMLWRMNRRLSLFLPAHKAAVIFGMLGALLYALLSGFAVPAQRTVYMLSVVAIALWLGRFSSASLMLSIALLVVTLFDPWAVLSAGFWLSFGAVALIVYISAGRIAKPNWLSEWLKVQWAVTLGLIPILMALFQQVSLVSPLANAVAIPLVSLVVVPLTLLGIVLPLDLIFLLAHQIMSWCMAFLIWLDRLPISVWYQHAPPLWAVVIAGIGATWLLLPKGFPARWLGIVGFLPLFFITPAKPNAGAFKVTVLDVGQGLAVVVQTQHHALLYDAGPVFSVDTDSGNRIIIPFLRATGILHIDGMIISHDDIDHSGGAMSVLKAVPVGWLASSLPQSNELLQFAKAIPCYTGQNWQWDGIKFEMLHPTLQSYQLNKLKDNARGCVLRISNAIGSVLLPADIEQSSEEAILQRSTDELASSIMIAPHHGSKSSSSSAFIEAVKPQAVIFAVGYRNRFRHPNTGVVERYLKLGSSIYRTDQDGALLIDLDKEITIQKWRQTRRRYWQE